MHHAEETESKSDLANTVYSQVNYGEQEEEQNENL